MIYRVTLADQSAYDARVVGYDQDKDVAVLRIEAPKDKLRPVPIGISADLLVGQKVFAIGNPVSLVLYSMFVCMIALLHNINIFSLLNIYHTETSLIRRK